MSHRAGAKMRAKKDGGDEAGSKKPLYVKYGINHITKLCEDKKAQLVCIAHDVDPIEVRAPSPLFCLLPSASRRASAAPPLLARSRLLPRLRCVPLIAA